LSLRRKRDFGARIENLVRNPEFSAYLARGETGSVTLRIMQGSAEECWLAIGLVTGSDAQRKLLVIRDVSREARVESMRKDFVANASHELRSPLTVISGYLDSLADDPDLLPVWSEPVREMLRQAQRMRGIVEKLLELSRLEATTELLDERPIDVGGLLALLRKDFLAEAARPQTIALESASDAFLYGAETEINSIFSNLISNAVKYTPPEGRVEIRWWSDDAGGHVSVKDTGIGIPAEHIPRLTERFYRADAGRSRTTGGSGLGLAIVKHALQRHGGSLAIESEEGVGSTFTCHFPLSRLVARSDAA
jgi:two-component system phosphate regulon sensor histidine kinase PhoR